jgi:RHS repeat-associated protein
VGGLYERLTKVSGSTTTVEHTHYIRAGDEVVAIQKRTKVDANPVGAFVPRYPHRDHLGSVVALSDAGGALLERSGFDPWGKRTDYSTWAPPAPLQFLPGGSGAGGTTTAVTSTKRGFTGHEHLDELGFIHMNGRIYDPEIGKFLSADPTMQFPESTQGFNRYAYAGNNPLTNVDPSGFGFFKKLLKWIGIAMMFIIPTGINMLWERLLWAFTSGFLASGGDLKAGLIAAATAGLMHGIGTKFQKLAEATKNGLTAAQKLGKAFLEGLVGGLSSAASGRSFKEGFLGAFSSSAAGSWIRLSRNPRIATVQLSVIGGTISVIGGGKFGNGAITAAFAALYNWAAHLKSSKDTLSQQITEIERDLETRDSSGQSLGYEEQADVLEDVQLDTRRFRNALAEMPDDQLQATLKEAGISINAAKYREAALGRLDAQIDRLQDMIDQRRRMIEYGGGSPRSEYSIGVVHPAVLGRELAVCGNCFDYVSYVLPPPKIDEPVFRIPAIDGGN